MVASELSISAGGSMLAMTVEGPSHAADGRTGRSPHPGMGAQSTGNRAADPWPPRPTLETITARDGLTFTGWLFRPPRGVRPIGALIFLHGGPEGQARPGYNEFFPPLLDAGITVLTPECARLRRIRPDVHARRRPGAAIRRDRRRRRLRAVPRRQRPAPIRGRIACCGWSYGGYLTQAALAFHPDLFAAGISICGMSDLNTLYRNTEPWIAAAAYPKYGHPVSDRDLLDQLSPLLRVDALTAPLLLVHGVNDTNVPRQRIASRCARRCARAAAPCGAAVSTTTATRSTSGRTAPCWSTAMTRLAHVRRSPRPELVTLIDS